MFKNFLLTLILMLPAISAASDKTLYVRLGGKAAIQGVVDKFVENVLGDPTIQPFFAVTANEPGRAEKLKKHLVDQVCQVSGGPCTYTGRDMKTTHTNMGITDSQFDALVSALVKALDHYKVGSKEKDDLLAILAPLRTAIVEKK